MELFGERVEQTARGHVHFGVDGVVLLAQMLEHFGASRKHFMLGGFLHDIAENSETESQTQNEKASKLQSPTGECNF